MFGEIRALAADSRGRLYVVDSQAEMIRVFGREGDYVRTLGRPGQGPGELDLVRGAVIDQSDRVWALDGGNFRYAVWDSTGARVGTEERPFPHLPSELNGNADGDRLVERDFTPEPVTGAEIDEALDHEQVEHIRNLGGELDLDRIPRTKPVFQWVSVDDQGYLWVGLSSDAEGRTLVDVFDPDGRYLGQVPLPVQILPDPVPVVRSGSLRGTVRDAFDLQYVIKFRIAGR